MTTMLIILIIFSGMAVLTGANKGEGPKVIFLGSMSAFVIIELAERIISVL